jgi:hypothetical protein
MLKSRPWKSPTLKYDQPLIKQKTWGFFALVPRFPVVEVVVVVVVVGGGLKLPESLIISGPFSWPSPTAKLIVNIDRT